MASFSAYLEVGGSRYPLTYYDLFIHQQTDALGRPASLTQGGTITVELHSPPQTDTVLTDWMLSPTRQHDGFVHLYREDSKAKLKTVSFFNAYCVDMGVHFSASGSGPMLTSIVISPQRVAVGAVVHDNNWPVESHGAGITHTPPTPPKEPSALSEGLHTLLDVVGMIPVVGELADGANALMYAAEGNYAEAGMAAAAMIPLAGNVAGAAKLAKRFGKLVGNTKLLNRITGKAKKGITLFREGLEGVEKASKALIDKVASKRTVVIAKEGTDDFAYLEWMKAEANVGGETMEHILLKENPSKAALLEEFLHGTQHKLGMIKGDMDIPFAEWHVKDFMIRHKKILGLIDEDVDILKTLRDRDFSILQQAKNR
ncbi:type VI secretion system tube protein TssD [Fibrella aquatilis]|uniref:Uncharacterized protein n=1 Tax=Fibrella aquatilis TaxID=2817059 RepID=A0A939G4S5_9BACT|nr:type VI secretion system tube protein TssD [Fibrella aquatilis]MBO0932104.1 hypothetical protein [Fibrella aquatilis]